MTKVTAMVSPRARPMPRKPPRDALSPIGNHHVPDHLPCRAAKAIGGFLQGLRHHQKDIPGHRRNKRDYHECQDQPGSQHAYSHGSSGEKGEKSQSGFQKWLDIIRHQRSKDKESPHSVHNGRNGSQQFNGCSEGSPEPVRSQFGQKESDAKTERNRKQQGKKGGRPAFPQWESRLRIAHGPDSRSC